jgi:hypothetical protein
MTARRTTATGGTSLFTNDHTPFWGLPDNSTLGPSASGYSAFTGVFGEAALAPPNALYMAAANRLKWSSSQSRRGNGSLLFTVKTGDIGGSSTNRAQIENGYNRPPGRFSMGDDFWMAFSLMIPSGTDMPLTSNDWVVLLQLFAESDDNVTLGGSPPFAFEVEYTAQPPTGFSSPTGSDFCLTLQGGSKTSAGDTSHVTTSTVRFAAATFDVWHDFLWHLQLSKTASDTTGRVRCWHRTAGSAFPDDPNYDKTQVNMYSVGGVDLPIYPSYGIYRSNKTNDMQVYWGEVAIRRTREQAMRIFDPVPAAVGQSTWGTAVAQDTPVGWWKLDDTSGTTIVDSSTTADNGSSVNTPTLSVAGAGAGTGTSITFNGTNQYVTIPHNSATDVGDIFSVEAWVKFSGSGTYVIVSHGWDNNNAHLVPELLVVSGVWRLVFPNIQTIGVSNGPVINDNAWHHLVATKNAASIHLYQDGADVTSSPINSTGANGTTKGWTIGARDQNGVIQNYFPGSIDEVAIYNHALTQPRVLMHYFNKANP